MYFKSLARISRAGADDTFTGFKIQLMSNIIVLLALSH